MSQKPGDSFVGIVDFFSVLLPGTLLAFTVRLFSCDPVVSRLEPLLSDELGDTNEKWIAFALASDVIGHRVFHAGALLDFTYDTLYLRLKKLGIPHLKKGCRHPLFKRATELMTKSDKELTRNVKPLRWCSGYVRTHSEDAIELVDAFEASQKFAQSMVVIFAICAILYIRTHPYPGAIIFAALAGLSYLRYCRLRWKMTQAACLFYIQLRTAEAARQMPAS